MADILITTYETEITVTTVEESAAIAITTEESTIEIETGAGLNQTQVQTLIDANIDSELSETSEKALQNKVVKAEFDKHLGYIAELTDCACPITISSLTFELTGDDEATITCVASQGVGTLTYTLSKDGSDIESNETGVFVVESEGTYTVTVADEIGSTEASDDVEVAFIDGQYYADLQETRVLADSGTLRTKADAATVMQWHVDNDTVDYIDFNWAAEFSGLKIANPTDTLKRISKGYSLDQNATPNDFTQTVEANQIYLAGDIAPTEVYAGKNVAGASRFGEFNDLTFTNGDPWTVTFVGNWDGSNNADAGLIGKGNDSAGLISLRDNSTNRFRFINDAGDSVAGSLPINHIIGANTIVSFVAAGDGSLRIYMDGALFETLTVATGVTFSQFLKAFSTASRGFFGRCHYLEIMHYALTSLITSYHAMLRAMFARFETVQIGTQNWVTSNFDGACGVNGTLIPNVTDNAAWAALTTPAWCYCNNDPATGATYGKLYNGYAIRQIKQDIDAWNAANPTNPWGYHVPDGSEVTTLLNGLGSESDKYKHIKHSALWGIAGTNSTGFTLIPHGIRAGVNGSFTGINTRATLFSNTSYHTFYDDNSNYYTGSWDGRSGAALRLLKD